MKKTGIPYKMDEVINSNEYLIDAKEFAEMYNENGKKAESAKIISQKYFADVKTDYGIVAVDGKIYYGCHLRGTVTEKNKTAFSVLTTTIDDTKDIKLDTFIFGKVNDKNKLEIAEIEKNALYEWFFTQDTTIKLPKLSKEVKTLVLKDINKWKGMYVNVSGGKEPFKPILNLKEQDAKPILESTQYLEMCNQLHILGSQLKSELEIIEEQLKDVGLEGFIERYAFKEHVLVSGPSGASKTYTVDKYVRDKGYAKEFIAGAESIESTDLLGYSIRHVDGTFVWMDGPLTAAFRNAQVEKTVLFIDELLRIPSKELNILVGALTPNSNNEFVLRTNRLIDIENGIGKSETLVVPAENLWVVGTTNMGGNYDVNEMDLALNDRFMIIDVKIETDIIDSIIKSSDVNELGSVVQDKLLKLFNLVNSLVAAQELTYNMNIRHITKVMRNATEVDKIKSYLLDLAPQICSRTTDGVLNESELQIYRDTLDSIF